MEPLEAILARDPAWHPAAEVIDAWLASAEPPGAPPALLQEARWWRARAAAAAGDWERVSILADEGLGEPHSEREAFRLALLHALSGNVKQAQHVLAQAVQWAGGEDLLGRFAAACEREGLAEAAARFRLLSGRG